jgi:hypothetical protein
MLTRMLFTAFLAIAAAQLLSPASWADESASTEFKVTGTATKVCVLPAPVTTGTAANATFASNTISITQFIDPNTALVTPSRLSLQFPNTLCNYNAKVSLQSKSGGLVSTDASTIANGSGAFLQNVPYSVTANWGTFSLVLDTTASKGAAVTAASDTSGATSGNLTLTIATAASMLPVPQGTYQDTLLLKIGAPM